MAAPASSRARPAPDCGPSSATPAEAPAATLLAAKGKRQFVDRLLEDGSLRLGVGLAEIPQQQREPVATEPADHVRGADLPRQRPRNRLEHLVAGGVAEGVVDRLQPIDVEHDQRAAGAVALHVGDGARGARARSRAGSGCPAGNRCRRPPRVPRSGAPRCLELGPQAADDRLGCIRRRPIAPRRAGFRRALARAPGAAFWSGWRWSSALFGLRSARPFWFLHGHPAQ